MCTNVTFTRAFTFFIVFSTAIGCSSNSSDSDSSTSSSKVSTTTTSSIPTSNSSSSSSSSSSSVAQEKTIMAGRFRAPIVEGLTYSDGENTGTTDENGFFWYFQGSTVHFSVGNTDLGSATGKEIMTVFDLVPSTNPTSSSSEVSRRVQFLYSLDSDELETNGVQLTDDITQILATQEALDFASSDYDSKLEGLLDTIEAQVGEDVPSVSSDHANALFDQQYSCLLSGVYIGELDNEIAGDMVMFIKPKHYNPDEFGEDSPIGFGTVTSYLKLENGGSEGQGRVLYTGMNARNRLLFNQENELKIAWESVLDLAGNISPDGHNIDGNLYSYDNLQGDFQLYAPASELFEIGANFKSVGGFRTDKYDSDNLFDTLPSEGGGVVVLLFENDKVILSLESLETSSLISGTLTDNTIEIEAVIGTDLEITSSQIYVDYTGDMEEKVSYLTGVPSIHGKLILGDNTELSFNTSMCRVNNFYPESILGEL